MPTARPTPPLAKREPAHHELHGHHRRDDYAWLKDEGWQQVMRDPSCLRADIRAYLEAENAYTKAALADTEALQGTLFEEFRGRIKEDDSSVPAPDGPWEYYERYREGGQHPIVCRRPRGESAGEQVLLDGDAEAEGQSYYQIGDGGHSNDHHLYAWTVDLSGSEFYTLRVKDLETGELLPDVIEHCAGGFEWAGDDRHLFYTVLDDNHRPCKVLRHRLGTPVEEDVLVYEEPDPGFFVGVSLTESRRWLLVDSHDHVTSEVRLIDAAHPERDPVVVAPREPHVEYDVAHHDKRLIILTNADGAEDFKLVECPEENPGREQWTDLVAHRPGVLIVAFQVFRRWLVRLERENALPRVVVRDIDSGEEHVIAFDEEAYALGMGGGYEFDTDTLRFSYSSMTTPSEIFDYDMATRERVLRKVQEVPSGHDPAHYVTRRLMAPGHDGEPVPVSVLYHRDTPLDGSAPVLLYGYGSYGHAMPASFGTTRLSLVDRGFVYAIAHVRGGMERGYRWYSGGKLMNKRNTFRDFIAAAEHLAREGFTQPGQIAIQGGSAGGMLVGAAVNMRPDLFRAVVAEVPFVDVLNTMCDDTLPLTPPEWPEWGNPIASREAYDYIAAYSPYDNVEPKPYPAIIVTAGLTDPRVTYWEPAKWVAKLRATKTDDNLLVLHTNMEAGHGGAAGRLERLRETALVYAFLLVVFGLAAG
jgi:oligopeptidase B